MKNTSLATLIIATAVAVLASSTSYAKTLPANSKRAPGHHRMNFSARKGATRSHHSNIATLPLGSRESSLCGSNLWDGGAPSQADGSDITHYDLSEYFEMESPGTARSIGFWTIEAPGATWDGTAEFQIVADNAGEPGSEVLAEGPLTLSRTITGVTGDIGGFAFQESLFQGSFPEPVTLATAGDYWIRLHLGAECPEGSDTLYWETTNVQGEIPAVGWYTCNGDEYATGTSHAFQICGETVCTPTYSNAPADIIVNTEDGQCSAAVSWTPPTLDNSVCESPAASESSTNQPGDRFQLGSTRVEYTATNSFGGTAHVSFQVTVVDNQAPQATCPPADWTVEANDPDGFIFEPQVFDNCGRMTVIVSPDLHVFPFGTTEAVSMYVIDSEGYLSNQCVFDIHVNAPAGETSVRNPGITVDTGSNNEQ